MSVLSTFDCVKQWRWWYLILALVFIGATTSYLGVELGTSASYNNQLPIFQSGLVSSNHPYTHYTNSSIYYPANSYLDTSVISYLILYQIDCGQLLIDENKLLSSNIDQLNLTITYNTDIPAGSSCVGIIYSISPWISAVETYNDLSPVFVTWVSVSADQTNVHITLPASLTQGIIDQELYLAFTVLMPDNGHSLLAHPLESVLQYQVSGLDRNIWVNSFTWMIAGTGILLGIIFIVQNVLATRTVNACKAETEVLSNSFQK